jgi:hypothetical protein
LKRKWPTLGFFGIRILIVTASASDAPPGMQSSSTFRVSHQPLRHKYRRVWGGALVPGVLVLCFYAHVVLSAWNGYVQGGATGRRLLDEQLRHQKLRHQKLQLALKNHVLFDAMNSTAAHHARTDTAFDDLSRSAETLAVATSAVGALTAVTSLGFVCLLWRRVNQLQGMLQAEAVLRV